MTIRHTEQPPTDDKPRWDYSKINTSLLESNLALMAVTLAIVSFIPSGGFISYFIRSTGAIDILLASITTIDHVFDVASIWPNSASSKAYRLFFARLNSDLIRRVYTAQWALFIVILMIFATIVVLSPA